MIGPIKSSIGSVYHGQRFYHENHKQCFVFFSSLRLETKTGLQLRPLMYQHLGVSLETGKVESGIMDKANHNRLKEALVQLLRKEGFHYEEALITINQVS